MSENFETELDRTLAEKVERGEPLDQAEVVVLAAGRLTPRNRVTLMKHLRFLESKAKPLNWAWNVLEQTFGYDGDRTAKDYGTPPNVPI